MLLVGCVVLFNAVEHVADQRATAPQVAHEPVDGRAGASLVLRDRYLLLIAALVLVAEL